MKRFLPILAVLILFNSCFEQNDCVVTSTNLVKVSLVTKAGVSQSVFFLAVQQDLAGENNDETHHFVTYERTTAPINFVTLPLDPGRSKTYYSFLTSDSLAFHLSLSYSTYTRVISDDCGAYLYFDNLKVEETDFPETLVTTPQLFKSVTTNLKVFF